MSSIDLLKVGRQALYAEGWNQKHIKVREPWMRTGFSINRRVEHPIGLGDLTRKDKEATSK